MPTDDMRLERIEGEYQTVRGTQNKLMDRMNGYGDFLQRLSYSRGRYSKSRTASQKRSTFRSLTSSKPRIMSGSCASCAARP